MDKYRTHTCDTCEYSYTAKVRYSTHTQNLSGEPTEYCPKCNKCVSFSSAARSSMNTEEAIKEINKLRKAGGWYQFARLVNGKPLMLKGHGTWIQCIGQNNWVDSGIADISVKQFNAQLAHWLA